MDAKFTVEEGNLIAIYTGSAPDRRTAVDGIQGVLKYIDDADIFELANNTVEKLNRMSDAEFMKEYLEPVVR